MMCRTSSAAAFDKSASAASEPRRRTWRKTRIGHVRERSGGGGCPPKGGRGGRPVSECAPGGPGCWCRRCGVEGRGGQGRCVAHLGGGVKQLLQFRVAVVRGDLGQGAQHLQQGDALLVGGVGG